ncbi:hypothetical protein [Kitasatospora phosalacinea]|uniref:Lipoprotein n=1 Tax=Kitasatospora phosalacinea TaxID=2065 RepID=A0ABW6GHZ4_9ACTN
MTAGAALLGGGLVACSTVEQLNAGEKLQNAFDKLGDARTIKIDLSLDASPADLVAFGEAVDEPIEKQAADLLSDLSISVSVSYDKPLKDLKGFDSGCGAAGEAGGGTEGAAIGYALNSKKDGKTYADVRVVGDKAYLKADVRGIAELAGEDPGEIDRALEEMPAEAAPLKELFDGKWVSVGLDDFKELSGQMTGAGPGAGVNEDEPALDPSVLQHFCDSVKGALADNVTLKDLGKTGDADVIRVSAPIRPLVKSLYDSFSTVAEDLPGYSDGVLPGDGALDGVPNRNFHADVELKDGQARAVTFDLAQFADQEGWTAHLPLRIGISGGGDGVTAPTGATDLGLDKLQEMFAAMDEASGYEDDTAYPGDEDFGSGFDTPALPLTESEYAQLEDLGIDRETAEELNQGGLGFLQIKALGPELV